MASDWQYQSPGSPAARPGPDRVRINALLMLVSAVLAVGALALPWVGRGGQTISAFEFIDHADDVGDGPIDHAVTAMQVVQWSGIALAVLSVLWLFAPGVRLAGTALLPALVLFGAAAVALEELYRALDDAGRYAPSLSPGGYLTVVAALVALAAAARGPGLQRPAG
ncbi:hypothetical protein [Kitasatospora sp. NPDC057198]|uniref:hypothetical protein n=1 Tax=Kitasatospora sp. NPDC057198 TaxID=3346046 RepID=UPI0036306D00